MAKLLGNGRFRFMLKIITIVIKKSNINTKDLDNIIEKLKEKEKPKKEVK